MSTAPTPLTVVFLLAYRVTLSTEEADESVTILSIDVKVEVSGASDGKSNKRKGKKKKK